MVTSEQQANQKTVMDQTGMKHHITGVELTSTNESRSFITDVVDLTNENSLSEVTHDSHFSTSSFAPSTESVSAKESSPGATDPRPFNKRDDGSPPIPLLQIISHLGQNPLVLF